jgi:hypothetical protein
MSSGLLDLTLPARDASFPKPRGPVPVPQEIEEAVAGEEARVTRDHIERIEDTHLLSL